jgi:uncharacterized membrane protein YfcA
MPELTLRLAVPIITLAFLCEYMDSTLGMGYGTVMAPLLMLFGFVPLQIVPAILLSELVTGLSSGLLHHREGNVNFQFQVLNFQRIKDSLRLPEPAGPDCYTYGIHISQHLKVVFLLLAATLLGATSAVFTARLLPARWTSLYISVMVIAMGLLILACFNRKFRYSWKRIVGLGLLASFNKGLTGGGYGPLVVSGQLLSGVETKSAVGITSLAEGVTCALGVAVYLFTAGSAIDWRLAPLISGGALCAVPFSAKRVKHINPERLKLLIAVLTIVLGVFTLLKTLRTF